MEREVILDRMNEEEKKTDNKKIDIDVLPYEKQQQELKKAFLNAVDELDTLKDENDDLIKPRKKTESEQQNFENEYQEWLKERKMNSLKDGDVLVKYWEDNKLDEKEKFLRDYILNNGWIDKNKKNDNYVPIYDEIIDDNDSEEINKQSKFENDYNLRYENGTVPTFPREVVSLRKESSKRKEKRLKQKENQLTEKQKKMEQLKRLKELKKKEILKKLQDIKQISGTDVIPEELNFDLEKDFDPEEHQKMMDKMFNEDYYEKGADEEPPEFEDDSIEDYLKGKKIIKKTN